MNLFGVKRMIRWLALFAFGYDPTSLRKQILYFFLFKEKKTENIIFFLFSGKGKEHGN
jgi:hypothetical protein